MILFQTLIESTIDIPRMNDIEAYVEGTVDDIEYKNDKAYIYIKNVKYTDSANILSNQKEEVINDNITNNKSNVFLKHLGCVCIFKEKEYVEKLTEEKRINIGSKIILRGSLNVYEKASNPGQFDARNYYISKGYIYKLRNCEFIESNRKINYPKTISKKLRDSISSLYDDFLPEDEAAIMRAITLADRNDLDNETKDLFADSGSGHLLAVSGLHISLIAGILLAIFKKILKSPDAAYVPAMIMLVLYGFLIGFSPSSLRAIVMFIILCIGKMRKKSYDTLTAMAVAALITAIIKPLSCLQSGFHMSYLAIMGIAIVNPSLNSYKGKKRKIRDAFLMSVSVTLMTLPVIANSYYKVPILAVFLNLILIPGMTFLLSFGFIFLFVKGLSLIISPLGILAKVLAFIIHIILKLYMILMKLSLSFPFSELICGYKNIFKCAIYFTVLVLASLIVKTILQEYWRMGKRKNNRIRILSVNKKLKPEEGFQNEIIERKITRNKWRVRIVYMLVLSINAIVFLAHTTKNKIDFLDVGQGLCACLFYNGDIFMYDCGSSDNDSLYEMVIKPYLYYNGVKDIDILFLSHDDKDHISAAIPMIEDDAIYVNSLMVAEVLKEDFSKVVESKINSESNNSGIYFVKRGDNLTLQKGKINFLCISPTLDSSGSANADSLVLFVTTKEGNILFMGDAETEAERRVMEYNIHPDILQSAHHGSGKDTNSMEFLKKTKPKITVISCGFNNRYKHPADSTIENLNKVNSKIKRTDYEGCISILLR